MENKNLYKYLGYKAPPERSRKSEFLAKSLANFYGFVKHFNCQLNCNAFSKNNDFPKLLREVF